MKRFFALVMLCVFMNFLGIGDIQAQSTAWPVIHEESGRMAFDKPAEADFTKAITDLDGRPLYEFRCRSGDLDDVDNFNYSGLLQCRLSVVNAARETSRSLLFEDHKATSDWDGRGRFMLNDVIGPCGRYPDWGNTRIYRVRGMQLTLRIENVRLRKGDNGQISAASFVFTYAVRPNRKAIAELTEKPLTKEPSWFSGGEKCLDEMRDAL